ncbi:MAG TPA: hypothetical protein VEC99_12315 [Clostridia bacterium]|nr:hypothetical protein [Clostridia bacterium]
MGQASLLNGKVGGHMDCSKIDLFPARGVLLFLRDGVWVVQVIEEEGAFEQEFLIETHANSYASGQRIRLGLPQNNSDVVR